MNSEEQKAIFITGSSSGLGRATAKLFASKGWRVIQPCSHPPTLWHVASGPHEIWLARLPLYNSHQVAIRIAHELSLVEF